MALRASSTRATDTLTDTVWFMHRIQLTVAIAMGLFVSGCGCASAPVADPWSKYEGQCWDSTETNGGGSAARDIRYVGPTNRTGNIVVYGSTDGSCKSKSFGGLLVRAPTQSQAASLCASISGTDLAGNSNARNELKMPAAPSDAWACTGQQYPL